MDVVAHVLITNALFHSKYRHRRKLRYLSALFGVLPDLMSFTPVIFYVLFTGQFSQPRNYVEFHHWTYTYATWSYQYTHSLVIFAAVFLAVLAFRKGKPFWPLLGWPVHIALDIFTHPDFFHTPIFYPISQFQNSYGISWAEPTFFAGTYIIIALIYLGIYLWEKKTKKASN